MENVQFSRRPGRFRGRPDDDLATTGRRLRHRPGPMDGLPGRPGPCHVRIQSRSASVCHAMETFPTAVPTVVRGASRRSSFSQRRDNGGRSGPKRPPVRVEVTSGRAGGAGRPGRAELVGRNWSGGTGSLRWCGEAAAGVPRTPSPFATCRDVRHPGRVVLMVVWFFRGKTAVAAMESSPPTPVEANMTMGGAIMRNGDGQPTERERARTRARSRLRARARATDGLHSGRQDDLREDGPTAA